MGGLQAAVIVNLSEDEGVVLPAIRFGEGNFSFHDNIASVKDTALIRRHTDDKYGNIPKQISFEPGDAPKGEKTAAQNFSFPGDRSAAVLIRCFRAPIERQRIFPPAGRHVLTPQ